MSGMSTDVEKIIFKEYGFLKDTHLLWKTTRKKLESTTSQDSAEGTSLANPARPL
jgi:hypothetical protein